MLITTNSSDLPVEYSTDGGANWFVTEGGVFDTYVGFVPNDFALSSLASSTAPKDLFEKGWYGTEVGFDNTMRVSSIRCGAPSRANYFLFAFVDGNKNGTFDVDANHYALEPYGFYGSVDGSYPGATIFVDDELYGLEIILKDDSGLFS